MLELESLRTNELQPARGQLLELRQDHDFTLILVWPVPPHADVADPRGGGVCER